MFKLIAILAFIIGLTHAVPVHELPYRRLDPSVPEEIEDFEVSQDEDNDNNNGDSDSDTVIIDAAEPEPPSKVEDWEEENSGGNSKRQQGRLDYLSANYEQFSAQESQLFANLHNIDANQAEMRSNIEEDGADVHDLEQFSNWLGGEAQAQKEFATELNGTGDVDKEERIGEILQDMSDLAATNARLERVGITKEERQVELQSDIRHAEEQQVGKKSEQTELQLDQIYLEHEMIDNEKRFVALDRELGYEISSDHDTSSGEAGFIGVEDGKADDDAIEPEPEDGHQNVDGDAAPVAAAAE